MKGAIFMTKESICAIERLWRTAVLTIVLALLATGCVSHVKELRDAQDEFNAAAAIDNRQRLDEAAESINTAMAAASTGNKQRLAEAADTIDTVMLRSRVDARYRLAIKMLGDLIEKNSKELLSDRLLGTAYTLKAMAEWRVGDYEASLRTLEASAKTKGMEILVRDRALQQALEGLIMNDQAVFHMRKKDYTYQQVKDLLIHALAGIKQGLSAAESGDPVRLYLFMSEMAVLKNWVDLRGEYEKYSTSAAGTVNKDTERSVWCESAKSVWGDFEKELSLLGEQRAGGIRNYWKRLADVPGTCP